jgi:hypothetical protein
MLTPTMHRHTSIEVVSAIDFAVSRAHVRQQLGFLTIGHLGARPIATLNFKCELKTFVTNDKLLSGILQCHSRRTSIKLQAVLSSDCDDSDVLTV